VPTIVAALLCVGALIALAPVAAFAAARRSGSTLVYGATLTATGIASFVSLYHLLALPPAAVTLPLGLPWLGAHLRIDALSAVFLFVVNLGGALASLYGLGYGRHEKAPARVLPFFPVFLAAMNLVVLADDAFTFLLCWELMSLVSWGLVVAHHEDAENRRAGQIYLVMASFGTLALLLGFGLLAGAGGAYDFTSIREAAAGAPTSTLVLALVLIGAGSKAGLVPLHVWLPLAHPAAPSHVSALMSGVMTKVAVYAFVRIAFDLLGESVWWHGALVLALGGGTAALGVLYALMQHDLKRLLAYHTVENIGIIFIGLGLALAFEAAGMSAAAALALTAALFHALNHSLFKSLLFMGAGSVVSATGHRDMEQLGGLIHRMPLTAFAFLAGCVAISALPPLNGFVSEWLTFQAILQSPDLPQWTLKLLVPAVGGLLALSAALAAACFVKAFGVSFLGRPRSASAARAHETDRWQLGAMLVLVALCVAAGVVPGFVIDALAPVTQLLVADRMPVQQAVPWLSIVPVAEARSSYNGWLVLLFIAFGAGFAAWAIHRFASRAVRRAPAWDCGFPGVGPQGQYTATSFAQPIRRVFGPLVFAASEQVDMAPPGDARPSRLVVVLRDRIWDGLYAPLARVIDIAAERLNRLQFLTIRRYLTLVFLALVLLLLVVAAWQ
jgi:hydrogenase-4 component B